MKIRHLSEEQLVGLVVGNGETGRLGRDHVLKCAECRAKYDDLEDLTASLRHPRAIPPVAGWSRLRERLARSRRPIRDWTEPRWLPLVLIHFGVVVTGLVLILAFGSWLESSVAWQWITRLPLVSAIGPIGLIVLAFLAGGGLFVLALTPILSWETGSRSSR